MGIAISGSWNVQEIANVENCRQIGRFTTANIQSMVEGAKTTGRCENRLALPSWLTKEDTLAMKMAYVEGMIERKRIENCQ